MKDKEETQAKSSADTSQVDSVTALRELADNLATESESQPLILPEEMQRTIHKLHVHQIELEKQNEELRRLQVELEGARERYFELYDLAPVGYCTLNEKGLILETNLTAAIMLGVPHSQLLKRAFRKYIIREDEDVFYQYRKHIFETEDAQTCELRMVKNDGTSFWVLLKATIGKNPDEWSIVMSDISERKQMEENHHQIEVKYRKAFETSPDSININRLEDGLYIDVNQGFLEMSGYTAAEVIGKSSLEINIWVNAQDRQRLIKGLREYGEVINLEAPFRIKNGQIKICLMSAKIIEIDNVSCILSITRDITERKRMETALQESEAKYRSLAEDINDVIFEVDTKGVITYISPVIHSITGYNPKELLGEKFEDFIYKDDLSLLKERYKSVLSGENLSTEYRLNTKAGGYAWVRSSSKPIVKDEHVIGLRGVLSDISETKQAEVVMRENERRLATLISNLPGFVYRSANDHNWTMEFISDGCQEVTGYTAVDFLNNQKLAYNDIVHPDYQAPLWQKWQKVIQLREVFEEEYPIISASGETRWVWERGQGVFSESKQLLFLEGFITDITERKRAEEALRESEAMFKAVSEYAHNAICLVDESGKILWVNESFYKMGGYSNEQIFAAASFAAFIAPQSLDFVLSNFTKFVQREAYKHNYSFYFIRADLQERLCEKQMTDYENKYGKRILAISMLDVTESKQAENALAQERNLLRTLIDHIPDAVYVLDSKGRKTISNKADLAFMGKENEADILGKDDTELFSPKQAEKYIKDNKKVLELGQKLLEHEEEVQDGAGNWHWVLTSKVPLHDFSGEIIGLVGIGHDITERKRMEKEKEKLQEQLLQSQKMESVGRLAGGVAHDFNNSLGIIMGFTEVALEKTSPEQSVFHDLQEIYRAAAHSAELTHQLLGFARKQIIDQRVLDLNDAVSFSLKMLRRLIGENIELLWRPGSNLWHIKIDPMQIEQIFTNLLVNARDAISVSGSITLETNNVLLDETYCSQYEGLIPGAYVMLSVNDNGCGMDSETLSHLFEPFFTSKDVGKGTGLGLATVYGIVKQNKGNIYVYSELGQGSIFKVYLPREEEEIIPLTLVEKKKTTLGKGETVLLVEDEEILLELSKDVLERFGYVVLAAETPDEAINLMQEHSGAIHLLITDVVMPGMNGKELTDKLRVIQPGLKCLFMSGYTEEIITKQGIIPQGMYFIQKPFPLKDLAAKVSEIIEP